MSLTKTITFGDHTLTIETGKIARLASGAAMVDLDGTSVLVTVVAESEAEIGKDFFPLRVDYQEKYYASGKIPGGFLKREGRPSEREVLVARLIDRPVRPLFPEKFCNEVQIIATVMSINPEIEPDIVAMIGASAALMLSGVPFSGPVGAARVGYQNGQYILNPTQEQLATSELDLVVAGTQDSVLMVESEAKQLPEDIMLGAVTFGHEGFQPVITMIQELVAEAKTVPWDWQPPAEDTSLLEQVTASHQAAIEQAYATPTKAERQEQLKTIKADIIDKYLPSTENASDNAAESSEITEHQLKAIFDKLSKQIVRTKILRGDNRIDGRDTTTVRQITIETGLLPRTHGSALFTRGETQALVASTLGTAKDAQIVDNVLGDEKDKFMLHYNFPPFSVGEVGMVGSPKRREIGHGRLAKRALIGVLPNLEEFPYVLRVVSEITESNGSSSMATVCGASLALMDAGVALTQPVAGIAMGLIKEGDKFAVLTDILGDEDHLGDMDFKVAGSDQGVTALQMDIKIPGITKEIMQQALAQAKEGRLHILNIMRQELPEPRELSKYAPRILSMRVHPDKIKDIIGKGGATIRGIIDNTGATIDISEDGLIHISSVGGEAALKARQQIEDLTAEAEVGKIYQGKVVKIADFGAFVNILPGKDGLVHVSQIANHRVNDVSQELSEGQTVKVKLLEIDRQGRLKLSIKAALMEN